MTNSSETYDVIIAGAGPAGSSAAIQLAKTGMRVLLIEQKKFPRAKLCGEFISPECIDHFRRLGVVAEMISARPAVLTETVFYSQSGKSLTVPSGWFGGSGALGLSRAVMDSNLLQRARSAGATVLENTSVSGVLEEQDRVRGVRLKSDGIEREYRSLITIDATGRARALARKVSGVQVKGSRKPKLVAFKVHLERTKVAGSACEIYFYRGGYGGLSTIENGLSNLCFIATARAVRRYHSDPEIVLRETLLTNRRAADTLNAAVVTSDWLSVSLERFGREQPSPVAGLVTIGDSAAFIDPFTGSGMLMAFESGQLASRLIVRHVDSLKNEIGFITLASEYNREYRKTFDSRLRICSLLRRAAFTPGLAEIGIGVFGASERLRNRIVRATRSASGKESLVQ